jgi:hypothetical protein
MKTIISFISFVSAVTLAGIGIETFNNLALIAGLFFVVLTVLTVFSDAKNDLINSKN